MKSVLLKIRNFRAYCHLMRINQPGGLFLLLWPTLWALWLSAMQSPPIKILLVFILGVVFMRSAGCVVNDIIDRAIDGYIPRTQDRPLPSGRVSIPEAKILSIGLLLMSFFLVLTLNMITLYLSLCGLALTCMYPFMKRYTDLPQVVLGVSFSWGIPMAWAAVSDNTPINCWLLFLANLFWVVSYDTQYAMADRSHDLKIGVKSTAILFDSYDRIIIGMLQLAVLILLILVGFVTGLHYVFYGAIFIACILFIYQQVLIAKRQECLCLRAFHHNNWVGLIVFIGIAFSV
ncbi:4-hydroxybenzoate octaprenyltransferase [Candidatus Erwinia haradaeae]|uniref:4-hydroxybenzoate octaprenyltransferase n=1 Tax=Candidatus Erwinia haradaeae TaxID=1922217 RepID=A0A451DCB8_9GAMM|nr:4-hydroxybenzoate octaprenyltransferase [Candidatus Erwinia haradaeae]